MQQLEKEIDDFPALPAELLSDSLPDKFCESCQSMIPAKFFLQRPRNRCKFCVQRQRELGQRQHLDNVAQDERLAALQSEVKKDPINLPSVRDWLNEIVSQDGGLEESVKKMLACVARVQKANEASRFPAEFRLMILKLSVALESIENRNRPPEAQISVAEAHAVWARLERLAMARLSSEDQQQLLDSPASPSP